MSCSILIFRAQNEVSSWMRQEKAAEGREFFRENFRHLMRMRI